MRTFIFIFVCVTLMWGFFSCLETQSDNDLKAANPGLAGSDGVAADGLDLQALMGLAKTVQNAEELEKKLNQPGGINNLDLNEDDQVDYIAVTEYGNKDAYGFSLTTEPVKGEVQEVATLEFQREGQDQVRYRATGSPNIYGPLMTYMAVDAVTDMMLWGYLLSRPSPWVSPYRWGAYPSYYRPYRYSSYNNYYSRTRSLASRTKATRTSSPRSLPITSPNKGMVAGSGIKKSLASPTKAQKSFQARNPSKMAKSGGFGRSSSSSSRSKSARSSSSSRGFGGRGK